MKFRIFLWLVLFGLGFCLLETFKIGGEKIVFCNVGQGDAILIKTEGRKVLVDTGPKNGKVYECLAKNMPFWDKSIDLLIITHPDSDHNGNEEEIKRIYKIEKLINKEVVEKDDEIKVGKSVFRVLNSGGETSNGGSIVLDFDFKGRKILLTGDMEEETENKLVWRKEIGEKYDLLKVSHHGSNTASSELFLRRIKPKIAVVSVGKNSYGHPDNIVVKDWKNGAEWYIGQMKAEI